MENEKLNQEYSKEPSLIDYLKIVKKHFTLLLGLTIGTAVLIIVLGFSLGLVYKSSATVVLGKTDTNLIETQDEVIDFIKMADASLKVAKGKNSRVVIITAGGFSPQDANNHLKKNLDLILERHSLIYKQKKDFLNSQIQDVEKYILESEKQINFFENQLKAAYFSEAQAVALGGYLQNYWLVLVEKAELESQSQIYEETKVLKIIPSSSSSGYFIWAVLLGLGMGLLFGLCWVFTKEWWLNNKKLLE